MDRLPKGAEWFLVLRLLMRLSILFIIATIVVLIWETRDIAKSSIVEFFRAKPVIHRYDIHCPDNRQEVKQMYFYDHEAKKKLKLMFVGFDPLVTNAANALGDDKPIVHVCR